MPDIIDEANERADLFRENALSAKMAELSLGGVPETPLYLDGIRCCLDCEEPISLRRLEIQPDAVRCVPCQTGHDERRKAKLGKI